MSSIFIIKCIGCKVKFDQGDSQRRKCDECVMKFYNKSREKYNVKRDKKRRTGLAQRETSINVCLYCESEFRAITPHKKYCSNTCRQKFWNLSWTKKTTQAQIVKLNNRLDEINKRLNKRNKLTT